MRMNKLVAHLLIISLALPYPAFAANGTKKTPGGAVCPTCGGGAQMMPAHVSGLDMNLDQILNATACPNISPAQLQKQNAECGKDMACNFLRGAINVATVGGFTLGQTLAAKLKEAKGGLDKDKSCLNTSQGDCATNIIAGVLKDLWANLEGIGLLAKALVWDAPKAAIQAGWKKAKDWYKDPKMEVQKVEDAGATAMHWAGTLSVEKVKQYKTDAAGFFKSMFKSMYDSLMGFFKKNFGCAKWSGVPHASKCVEPWTDLACANCSQQINMFCGALGVIVTEGLLINMLFTKGAALLKNSGAMSKVGKALRAAKPKKAKAVAAAAKDAKATAKAAEAGKVAKAAAKTETQAAKVATEDLFKVKTKGAKVSKAERARYTDRYVAEVEDIKATLPGTLTAEQKEAAAIRKLKELEKKGLKEDDIHKLYDDAAAARASAVKPINYNVDISYIDNAVADGLRSRYSQQITDLREALKLEDDAFKTLVETNPKQADDFLVHTLNQMEKSGMKTDAVKAKVHEAVSKCGID